MIFGPVSVNPKVNRSPRTVTVQRAYRKHSKIENLFDFSVDKQMFGSYNKNISRTNVWKQKFGGVRMGAENKMNREEAHRKNRECAAKRQQESRRRICIFSLTMLLIFGLGVGFGTLLAKAQTQPEDTFYKYYANIEIERGDTLWDLADTYMDRAHYETRNDYIAEVMSINGMATDCLIAGQKMIVPYYSAELK